MGLAGYKLELELEAGSVQGSVKAGSPKAHERAPLARGYESRQAPHPQKSGNLHNRYR